MVIDMFVVAVQESKKYSKYGEKEEITPRIVSAKAGT